MKRRYEFKARLWQSISVVALCSAFTLIAAGCGEVFHQSKHTGPFTVADSGNGGITAERANQEVFVMRFYNEHPYFPAGTRIADVAYEDKDRDRQYFVTATLAAGETIIPPKAKFPPTHVDCARGGCVLDNYRGGVIWQSSN